MTAGTGLLGRQLLAVRNSIRGEADPSRLRKLRRREIRLLVELGNPRAAEAAAEDLLAENSHWPVAYSIMADLACRDGRWNSAEDLFRKAAEEHLLAGDPAGADRLSTGPLYRLAEARGDHSLCAELCSGEGDLKAVLSARCRRLAGIDGTGAIPEPADLLALRLARLEAAWSGSSHDELLDMADEWKSTEPEWRWRFIVESIHLWKNRGLDTARWGGPLRDTSCPVLDPRFNEEWRILRP